MRSTWTAAALLLVFSSLGARAERPDCRLREGGQPPAAGNCVLPADAKATPPPTPVPGKPPGTTIPPEPGVPHLPPGSTKTGPGAPEPDDD